MATAVDKRGLGIAAGYLLVGLGSAFLSIALAALLAVASMVFLLLPICSSYARSRLKECSSISPVLVSIVGTACSLAIIMAAMMLYGKERDALRKTAAERARVKKESELVQKAMKDAEAKLAVNDIAGAIGVLAEAEDAKDGDGFDKLETHLDNCKKAASDEFFRSTVISMGMPNSRHSFFPGETRPDSSRTRN